MSDIRSRIEKLKQKRKVELPVCRSAKVMDVDISPEMAQFYSSRLAQQQEEMKENTESDNFENRVDMYGWNCKGDLSSFSADVFSFDSYTDFSACKLPSGFSPSEFMEKGKGYGQNIDELHKKGITGKGIKIAIIDQPLTNHKEYHGKLLHYEEVGFENKSLYGGMHGSCVTSLVVGDSCGVAPDAEVYYWATRFENPHLEGEDGKKSKKFVVEALKKCIELNRSLPNDEKISAVSISGCFDATMEGYEEYMKLREEAAKDGLEVVTCSLYKEKGLSMNGFNRDLTKDVNDESNIIPINNKIDKRVEKDWFAEDSRETLLISCDHRTMASEQGKNEYMHASRGGFSWLPPQVVGMYALAKQVNPNCSLEHMWKIALKTGFKSDKLNGVALSPVDMVEKLQQEYVLSNYLKNSKQQLM